MGQFGGPKWGPSETPDGIHGSPWNGPKDRQKEPSTDMGSRVLQTLRLWVQNGSKMGYFRGPDPEFGGFGGLDPRNGSIWGPGMITHELSETSHGWMVPSLGPLDHPTEGPSMLRGVQNGVQNGVNLGIPLELAILAILAN